MCCKQCAVAKVQVSNLPQATPQERLQSRAQLNPLVQARLEEVHAIRATVEALPEVQSARAAAATWQPLYNLAAWHGGHDAYKCASPYSPKLYSISPCSPKLYSVCTSVPLPVAALHCTVYTPPVVMDGQSR